MKIHTYVTYVSNGKYYGIQGLTFEDITRLGKVDDLYVVAIWR